MDDLSLSAGLFGCSRRTAKAAALRDSFNYLFNKQLVNALNAPFKKNGQSTLTTLEMTPQPIKIAGLSFKVIGPTEG